MPNDPGPSSSPPRVGAAQGGSTARSRRPPPCGGKSPQLRPRTGGPAVPARTVAADRCVRAPPPFAGARASRRPRDDPGRSEAVRSAAGTSGYAEIRRRFVRATGPAPVSIAGYNQTPPAQVVAGSRRSANLYRRCAPSRGDLRTLRDCRLTDRQDPLGRASPLPRRQAGIKSRRHLLVGDYGEGAPSTKRRCFSRTNSRSRRSAVCGSDLTAWSRRDVASDGSESEGSTRSASPSAAGSGHGWGGFINVSRIEVYGRPVPRTATAGAAAPAATCDRPCLRQALDRYLAALVTHEPAAAPLGPGFRYTENAVTVKPGDGLWDDQRFGQVNGATRRGHRGRRRSSD